MRVGHVLRIGELAELAGCTPSAVRYYEREGLLPAPERVGGQRRYSPEDADRVRLILVLRSVGLGIRDLGLALDRSAELAPERRKAARARASELRAQIARTTLALAVLDHAGTCSSPDIDDATCARDIERRLRDPMLTEPTTAPAAQDLIRAPRS